MDVPDLTYFERVSIQLEYAVPLVRDLQRILGAERVNAALSQRVRERTEAARRAPAAPLGPTAMRAAAEAYAAGDALAYRVLAADEERFDLDVTRCAYVGLMERLGARDLGELLICDLDHPVAAGAGLELRRTQTCMRGDAFCDFRYRRRSA